MSLAQRWLKSLHRLASGSKSSKRPRDNRRPMFERMEPRQLLAQTVGLSVQSPGSYEGYTLFAPKHNTMVYLIDNQGRVVNRWNTEYEPGQSVYLLENGHLLHCCFTKNGNFTRGGEGGRLEEYDWEGNLVWEFEYSTDKVLSHHDIAPLPNGNVSEHPELIDVHGSQRGIPAFWNHGNSIDYNADLDQIVLSARGFNEIWVIDHATTTEEAAGPAG